LQATVTVKNARSISRNLCRIIVNQLSREQQGLPQLGLPETV
jgi:hypothetical protein